MHHEPRSSLIVNTIVLQANCLQQPIGMGAQGQQPSHQAAHQAAHQAGQQGPPRRQQGLTGAAYPWAGMPHPPVTPQMQQAWNAAQEPHTVRDMHRASGVHGVKGGCMGSNGVKGGA